MVKDRAALFFGLSLPVAGLDSCVVQLQGPGVVVQVVNRFECLGQCNVVVVGKKESTENPPISLTWEYLQITPTAATVVT